MGAVVLGVMAIAGYAGTAGVSAQTFALQDPVPTTRVVSASNPALAMALATNGIASGGLPVVVEEPAPATTVSSLVSQSAPTSRPYTVRMGPADQASPVRFGALAVTPSEAGSGPAEVSLLAAAPLNLDVKVAYRRVTDETRQGVVRGGGTEVRIGKGLADRFNLPYRSGESKAWYLFAASDGRAVTWTPATDPAAPTSSVHLQRQVEVGDVQAGVGMDVRGVQASLAYVKRDVKTYIGPYKQTHDDSFAGLTLSWRR